MNNVWKSLALALVCCLGLACDTPSQGSGRPLGAQRGGPIADSTDLLRVGEKIQVLLADLPQGTIAADLTISEDGKITLHLDQTFEAAGKTRSKLETEIRARYVPNFYTKLTVTVKQEDRFVYVGSFVKAAGSYPYRPGLTLLKAIAAAGGFSEFGDKTKVTFEVKMQTELPLPFFLKAIAAPITQTELSKFFDRYIANVSKVLSA